jgi:hypothetical protein
MTDDAILAAHGFTQTQAADAMCKSPVRRSDAEKALVAALVQSAKDARND